MQCLDVIAWAFAARSRRKIGIPGFCCGLHDCLYLREGKRRTAPWPGAAARIEQERDCNRVSFHEQHARPAGGSPTAISPAIVRKPREERDGHHPGARAGLGRSSPLWRRRALHEEATRGSVKCFPDQCKANKSMTLYYKVKVGSWGSWRPLFSRAQRRRRTAAISCTPSLTTLKNATAMPY